MPRLSVLLVPLLGLVTPVAAQPKASAEADALFDRGRQLLDKKQYADACTAFDASQKLAPAVTTVFNQADCREKNKQFATAYGLWRDAERQTRAPLDDSTIKLNRLASDRAKKLEPKLSKLTVRIADEDKVANLEVLRNGEVIDPLLLGQPLPVDGGSYKITARATDHEEWSTTITVDKEVDVKSVSIPRLVEKPKAAPALSTTAGTTPLLVAAPEAPPSKTLPYIVGGGAVALLGGALGLELWARAQYSDAQKEPDDIRQESLWQGARTKRYLAQGFAVVGLGGAGVAVWLYVRSRGAERPERTDADGISFAPVVTPESTGFVVRGGF